MQDICSNISNIRAEIKEVSKDFSLANSNVTIIAVSKKQSVAKIIEAIECGQIDFAENYVQEAEEKWVDIKSKYPHVRLHLIGHLQSNKVKKALDLFDVIHSLDSLGLAKKISSIINENALKNKSFLVQINLEENSETKHGLSVKELTYFLQECQKLSLDVNGLMVVAPQDKIVYSQGIPVAPYFAFTKNLLDKHNFSELSMGMSGDYKTALRFGSTMLRLGTAIFGNR
jgi:pyridoxal phosphate enzyme (YggS family)